MEYGRYPPYLPPLAPLNVPQIEPGDSARLVKGQTRPRPASIVGPVATAPRSPPCPRQAAATPQRDLINIDGGVLRGGATVYRDAPDDLYARVRGSVDPGGRSAGNWDKAANAEVSSDATRAPPTSGHAILDVSTASGSYGDDWQ